MDGETNQEPQANYWLGRAFKKFFLINLTAEIIPEDSNWSPSTVVVVVSRKPSWG